MSNKAVRLWLLIGMSCFVLILPLAQWEKLAYQKTEPYFSNPLSTSSMALSLRNDQYGKGAFGASRNGGRRHMGLDLLAAIGDPVYAAKSGRVTFSGEQQGGYGKYIEILHPDGLKTCYAHLSVLGVQEGDWVPKLKAIGNSGNSGNATNHLIKPHLHFEIRNANRALDPMASLLDPSIQFIQ